SLRPGQSERRSAGYRRRDVRRDRGWRSRRVSGGDPGRTGRADVPTHAEPKEGDPESGRKGPRAGYPTIRDRVVQGALKLILESIFEADFQPGSFGYRVGRSAHEAVERVRSAIAREKTRVIDLDLKG